MRKISIATFAALCLVASASAQQQFRLPPRPLPVQTQHIETAPPAAQNLRNGQALTNPPGAFQAPQLTMQMLNAEQLRKIALLRQWGVNVNASQLGTPIWLTPQHPYIDANTFITVYSEGGPAVTNLAIPDYGVIHIPATTYEYLGHTVQLTINGSRSNQWWLMECAESDTQTFWLSSDYPAGKVGEDIGATSHLARPRAIENGYVSVLFEPNTLPKRTFRISNAHYNHGWNFYGCQFTPVTP